MSPTDPTASLLLVYDWDDGLKLKQVRRRKAACLAEISKKVRDLFDKTQSLPGVQDITEAEIAAEIEAYRSGE
ncbi:hypothetical protein A6S26_21910 [Nostoc sp. ATCC 43529]|nr:hypothetical protein A6S26_21910 [Nostoc sp. ATCC 43529]